MKRKLGWMVPFAALILAPIGMVLSAPPPPDKIASLQALTGGTLRVSYNNDTGFVRFLGARPDSPIPPSQGLPAGATAVQSARDFLGNYGSLFGLSNPVEELAPTRESVEPDGRTVVRFQQTHRGVPVLGGELIVQKDSKQNVLAAIGDILPGLELDTTPAVTADTARTTAIQAVAKYYALDAADLTASQPNLWIYHPMLLGAPGPQIAALVWRVDVTPTRLLPIRELVLVDARRGAILLNFNQVDTALSRLTYDAGNGTTLPGTLVCDETDPTCAAGDAHEAAAHNFAGAAYNFYLAEHGRLGIDNADMAILSTVHFDVDYANAFWNGAQMVYGDAYGFPLAEDVVGHELTHGVTERESGLFYFYQSGAINESLSDIWGEFIDLYQVTDNDAGDTPWDMGEDVSGWSAMRNLQDPTLHSQPDRITSAFWDCEQSQLDDPYTDNGGVHTNSGVNNKAAYLLTEGGTFNSYTIAPLGYHKVADLYYEVQTNLLTSGADYADLGDALIQACYNLGYSTDDCTAVENAVLATEMNLAPTVCPPTDAPVCDSGSANTVLFDDFESGSGNWTTAADPGLNYWYIPQTLAAGWGSYAVSGTGNIWGYNQEIISDMSAALDASIAIPSGAYLRFNHAYGFESSGDGTIGYDGGVVEYSLNGGVDWIDAGSLFDYNGYNGSIDSGYGNPLAGQEAFIADSRGYGSSRLDLSTLAGQSNVRFRFRMGTDSINGDFGWFIDDVHLYTCTTGPTNTPTVTGIPTITPTPTETPIPGSGSSSFIPLTMMNMCYTIPYNETIAWNLSKIDAPDAWCGPSGWSLTVAVLDTGADTDHPDLAANLLSGWNTFNSTSNSQDDHNHGSHVSGIIAGVANNRNIIGVAPKAKILPVKVLNSGGGGTTSSVANGIRWAADHGAQIINMSLGSVSNSTPIADAIVYAYNKGILIIAAAGNCGDSNYIANNCQYMNQPNYPAAYDAYVMAVAATDSLDNRASFSNVGSYVDVAAPGVSIYSATYTGGYAYFSGTSQATPHVAGLAALIWAAHPSWTRDMVRARIEATVLDIGTAGFDNSFGWGRIQAGAALSATFMANYFPAPREEQPVASSADAPFVPGRLIVRMRDGVTLMNALQSAGIPVVEFGIQSTGIITGVNAVVISVPEGQEKALAAKLNGTAGVVYAEPDYIFTIN